MAQPGRNERGEFARDDATSKQVVAALIGALKLVHEWMRNPAMDARMRQHHAATMASEISRAELALAEIDVGERPARRPDIERVTRYEAGRTEETT